MSQTKRVHNLMPIHAYVPNDYPPHEDGTTCWFEWDQRPFVADEVRFGNEQIARRNRLRGITDAVDTLTLPDSPMTARCRSSRADHDKLGWTPEAIEAIKVIDAMDTQYPPTNPAVLLAAARWAYLDGDIDGLNAIMRWFISIWKVTP